MYAWRIVRTVGDQGIPSMTFLHLIEKVTNSVLSTILSGREISRSLIWLRGALKRYLSMRYLKIQFCVLWDVRKTATYYHDAVIFQTSV